MQFPIQIQINLNNMKNQNATQELVDMLVAKHNLNRSKVVDYIVENGDTKSSFKIFLSGFIHELSINHKNLKTNLS